VAQVDECSDSEESWTGPALCGSLTPAVLRAGYRGAPDRKGASFLFRPCVRDRLSHRSKPTDGTIQHTVTEEDGIVHPAHPGERRLLVEIFLYLQILDVLTTLLGFSLGISEGSPFIQMMIRFGPVQGLVLSKILAVALAGACLWMGKRNLIRWIIYWYAALVVWNLTLILRTLNQ
jgi:hypothetical protein